MIDGFALPDETVTENPIIAAEQWASAFYMIKDALSVIRPIPEHILKGKSVRNLDEILSECDIALNIGEN